MSEFKQTIKAIDVGTMTHKELAHHLGGRTITFANSDVSDLKRLDKDQAKAILVNCTNSFVLA